MNAPKSERRFTRQEGVDPVLRRRARRRALQAIYAWQIAAGTDREIIAQFAHEQAIEIADLAYFERLVAGVISRRAQLDLALGPYLDRSIDAVDGVERGVLRIAAFELLYVLEIPYRVVINEAIEISKRFGSVQGYTYVNGVLDQAISVWRPHETRA